VTRRLSLTWEDPRPFRDGRTSIRILAASDEPDPALDHAANREALGRIDLVVGCGDLSPEQVAFLGDAFRVPLVYVRGNHDHGGAWRVAGNLVPTEASGIDERSLPGVTLLGLPWPGLEGGGGSRDEGAAWRQVLGALKLKALLPPALPWLVFSHAPPRGAGDTADDPYHLGFKAYRTVLDRLAPRLWIHGHTTRASQRTPVVEHGPTTLVNVTGSVLVELSPPS
jgi:hypothetical protein